MSSSLYLPGQFLMRMLLICIFEFDLMVSKFKLNKDLIKEVPIYITWVIFRLIKTYNLQYLYLHLRDHKSVMLRYGLITLITHEFQICISMYVSIAIKWFLDNVSIPN